MKKNASEFIETMIISALVGMTVALPFKFFLPGDWLPYLGSSALAGLCIGFAANAAFSLAERWIYRKPSLAFLSVIVTVGAGTGVFAYLFATRDPLLLACFIGLAEIGGIGATAYLWYRSRRLNQSLEKTKLKLHPKGSDANR